MSDLVERLRDRRYIGQEAMREEAATALTSAEEEIAKLREALKVAHSIGRVLIQGQSGQPSAALRDIFPEVFTGIADALTSPNPQTQASR
jgi:hypothetical protein